MGKEEFLKKIRVECKRFDKTETNKIVAYYDELINDKIEAGLDEEEAVSSLGDIKRIIEAARSELLFERSKSKGNFGLKTAVLILGICATPVLLPIGITFFVVFLIFIIVYGLLFITFGATALTCIIGFFPFVVTMGIWGYGFAAIASKGGAMLFAGGLMTLLMLLILKFGNIILHAINRIFSSFIKRIIKGEKS